ncbi:TetR/AcrR family transcriptional regulator [Yinghuangia sp. YIM S09857]|uniref:TetR/AcrR family transcriptional regulator n=1 Tax=Yinghuangia sp. YIM S09857 TaxID=3436929 RepID=UPI003F52EDD5
MTSTPPAKPPAKRGRPRAFDRDAALAKATRLFWERGYEATSIGELTRAMGINPPSLYAAFGDKKALFLEVVSAYGETHGAFTHKALNEEPRAYDGIARLLREAATSFTDPAHPRGCLVVCAATNVTEQSSDVEADLRALRADNIAAFERRFRAAVEAGETAPDADPHAMANFYAAVFQGMSQRARDGGTAAELLDIAEMAIAAWPQPQSESQPQPQR